jgi:hypothetical protein
MNVYPVAPVATAAAVAAVTHQWEAQKQQDEAHATEVLREAVQCAITAGVRVCGCWLAGASRLHEIGCTCATHKPQELVGLLHLTPPVPACTQVTKSCLHAHALPAAGGASGVSGCLHAATRSQSLLSVPASFRATASPHRSPSLTVHLPCAAAVFRHGRLAR